MGGQSTAKMITRQPKAMPCVFVGFYRVAQVSVFFADRGAKSGWWFGKSPHSEEAHHGRFGCVYAAKKAVRVMTQPLPGMRFILVRRRPSLFMCEVPKEPLPPSSGWHVPPEGGIDESMRFLSAVQAKAATWAAVSDRQEVHHLHYEPEEPVMNLTGPVEVKDAPMGDEVVSTLPPSTGLEEIPALQVLGCKDARTAALVDGLYEAAGITNGLPWFKKHGAEAPLEKAYDPENSPKARHTSCRSYIDET